MPTSIAVRRRLPTAHQSLRRRLMSSDGPPPDDVESDRTRAITIGIMIAIVVAGSVNLFYGPKMTLGEAMGVEKSDDIEFQRRFLEERKLVRKRDADARAVQ